MTSNNSDNFMLTQELLKSLIPQFKAYATEGFLMLAFNLPITCAVVRYRTLRRRKEYIVIAALSFGYAVAGLGFCTAGLGRWQMIVSGTAADLVSRWHCMTMPWTICWVFADHSLSLLLTMVSVDRLVAVFKPLVHYKLDRRYGIVLVSVAHAPAVFGLPGVAVWNWLEQREVKDVPAICFSEFVYSDTYYNLVYGQSTFFNAVYSILFIPVIIKLNRKNNQIGTGKKNQTAQQRAQARQRQLSVTLGICCVLAFMLSVLPGIALQIVYTYPLFSDDLKAYMIAVSANLGTVSPMANVILLCARHKDIRTAIIHLFTCKPLNANNLSTVI